MRKIIAALLVLAAPLAIVAAVAPPTASAATVTELGDLSGMSRIAQDSFELARGGDLTAAEKRITDFETAWDKAAGTMQPLSPTRWLSIDKAADRAIGALRAHSPNQADSEAALWALITELDSPGVDASGSATTPAAPTAAVAFAVTNADGSPLPCEVALKTHRDTATDKSPTDKARYDDLMNKGLERCNADDDKRADGFFADAFALLG